MICSICEGEIEVKATPEGEIYWDRGNNAEPVNSGRCCDTCNYQVVVPARFKVLLKDTLQEDNGHTG